MPMPGPRSVHRPALTLHLKTIGADVATFVHVTGHSCKHRGVGRRYPAIQTHDCLAGEVVRLGIQLVHRAFGVEQKRGAIAARHAPADTPVVAVAVFIHECSGPGFPGRPRQNQRRARPEHRAYHQYFSHIVFLFAPAAAKPVEHRTPVQRVQTATL